MQQQGKERRRRREKGEMWDVLGKAENQQREKIGELETYICL